jgi:hypothetical protein
MRQPARGLAVNPSEDSRCSVTPLYSRLKLLFKDSTDALVLSLKP